MLFLANENSEIGIERNGAVISAIRTYLHMDPKPISFLSKLSNAITELMRGYIVGGVDSIRIYLNLDTNTLFLRSTRTGPLELSRSNTNFDGFNLAPGRIIQFIPRYSITNEKGCIITLEIPGILEGKYFPDKNTYYKSKIKFTFVENKILRRRELCIEGKRQLYYKLFSKDELVIQPYKSYGSNSVIQRSSGKFSFNIRLPPTVKDFGMIHSYGGNGLLTLYFPPYDDNNENLDL